MAYGILVHLPEIELVPPAVDVQNFNHWTTREVPVFIFKIRNISQ